ncbi:hypothetical protein KIPB_013902, partial [Kipferlia bialata]
NVVTYIRDPDSGLLTYSDTLERPSPTTDTESTHTFGSSIAVCTTNTWNWASDKPEPKLWVADSALQLLHGYNRATTDDGWEWDFTIDGSTQVPTRNYASLVALDKDDSNEVYATSTREPGGTNTAPFVDYFNSSGQDLTVNRGKPYRLDRERV